MSKTDYITEMQDAFGQEQDPKELLKVAKKIKSLQKKSFSRKEFREELAMKLNAIHELDISEDIVPRFSVFQIFWALCSFVFISWALLSVYTMRSEDHSIISLPESPSIDSVQSLWDALLDQDLSRDFEQVQSSGANQVRESIPEKVILKQANTSSDIRATQEDDADTEIQSEATIVSPKNQGQSSDISTFWESISPASSILADELEAEDSQWIYELLLSEFLQICEENGWETSENEYECVLPNGLICNQDNISPESSNPCEALYDTWEVKDDDEVELDVWELIKDLGQ